MILILSQAASEPTTEDVIDWIQALGGRWMRINGEDLDDGLDIALEICKNGSVVRLFCKGEELTLSDIRAVWFRRWVRNRRHDQCDQLIGTEKLQRQISRHLTREARRLSDYLFWTLADRPWLSHPNSSRPNKLEVLRRAAIAGLDVPSTLVTTRRDELERFCSCRDKVVTKPIGDVSLLTDNGELYAMYTTLVDHELLARLPPFFPASFFQEYIAKHCEIRVFYLGGELYPMAIFSQQDAQTRVDFRRYNLLKPNRRVPYRLDIDTTERIRILMKNMHLDTGSLDLIRTLDGRLVLLEVNPVGQFGMVSKPCNYHLERKVAEYLMAKASYADQTQPL